MKKFALAIAAAFIAAAAITPALAQAPPTNWTGFYLGGNIGGAWGGSNTQTSTVFSPTGYFATTSVPAIATTGALKLNTSGFTGGGQAGYNWQSGNFVFGAEADVEALSLSGTATGGPTTYPCCAPTNFTVRNHVSADWMATLRPRLGYAAGNWLFYGTGGLALTSLKGSFNFTDTFATAAESAAVSGTKLGWAAGGGVEVALGPSWSIKAEYIHADFGSVSTTSTNLTAFTPPIPFPTSVFSHRASLTADIGRIGLNYHFGAPPPPPPAPMAAPMPPPAAPKVFIVFFDWDRDTITAEGHAIIQQAADAYRSGAPVQIQVTGYTDRSGSAGYNQRLSERRANNVARALAALGVPREQMAVSGRGENDNRVPTADGVREPQNRRVEIVTP